MACGHPAKPIVLLVLIGAALNGYAVKIVESLHQAGAGGLTIGISPFDLIVIFVAATVIIDARVDANDGAAPPASPACATVWPELLLGACCLIPSSSAAWAALLAYASFRALTNDNNTRIGFLLFAALAFISLWSSLAMRLLGPTITAVEAQIIAALFSIVFGTATASGNVVTGDQGFSLIVLAACSTADGLPRALLGLTAALIFAGVVDKRTILHSGAILSVVYFAANMLRLTLMTLSQDAYDWWHGPIGASLFDGLIVTTIFTLVAIRSETPAQARQA